MDFLSKLDAAVERNNSLLCVGLDPDMDKLPASVKSHPQPYFEFNKAIIDTTAGLVCAFKPNSAFYEALGAPGIEELKLTCDYINEKYPDIPIILDFKRGDIGNTNSYSAKFAFEYLGVDAVTVQAYPGRTAAQPLLDYKDKGIMVLCHFSNEGADEFQDLEVDGQKLFLKVAANVKNEWNIHGNCQLMVGATYPEQLAEARQLVGDEMMFLVPGLGAQGGDVEKFVKAGLNKSGKGLIINSSRSILYASNGDDYAEAARAKATGSRDEINKYRGVRS